MDHPEEDPREEEDAGAHRRISWRRRFLRAHIDDLSCLRSIVDSLSYCDFMLFCSIVLCTVLQGLFMS